MESTGDSPRRLVGSTRTFFAPTLHRVTHRYRGLPLMQTDATGHKLAPPASREGASHAVATVDLVGTRVIASGRFRPLFRDRNRRERWEMRWVGSFFVLVVAFAAVVGPSAANTMKIPPTVQVNVNLDYQEQDSYTSLHLHIDTSATFVLSATNAGEAVYAPQSGTHSYTYSLTESPDCRAEDSGTVPLSSTGGFFKIDKTMSTPSSLYYWWSGGRFLGNATTETCGDPSDPHAVAGDATSRQLVAYLRASLDTCRITRCHGLLPVLGSAHSTRGVW